MKVTMVKKQVRSNIKPLVAIPPCPPVLTKSITSGVKRMGINDTKISDKKLKISSSQNIHKKVEESDEDSDEESDEDSDEESDEESDEDSDEESDEETKVDKLEKPIIPILDQKIIPPKVELFKKIIPPKVELSKNVIPLVIDKWINPSLEYPNITNKTLKIVDKITTKYYTVVQYYFIGKPAYCKDWDKHFSSDIVSQIEGTTVTLIKNAKHWDIIPASFIFNNNNNVPTAIIHTYNKDSNINDTDIKVIIDDEITLVLRQVTCQIVNDLKQIYDDNQLTFKYYIISNCRFVTHFTSQINIYKNKNIVDPNKTWTLHLILNEKQMSIPNEAKNVINFIYKNKISTNPLSVLNLYQCLYLYFSQQINT